MRQSSARKWRSPRTRIILAQALSLTTLLALAACQPDPPPGPADTVQRFLRLMGESGIRSGPPGEVLSDEAALQEAYGLLAERTQGSLRERAELAASLAGGDYEPWNILIPGRFRLRFEPVAFEESIDEGPPRTARVRVRGRGEGEVADIPLVEEAGGWRIPLDIPPAAETTF